MLKNAKIHLYYSSDTIGGTDNMLRLKDIIKTYRVAGQDVPALKGVSLSFRANEFVSILGPSGCGKTTMLNIIGGLDHYTSGDLFIAGKSTKEFNDKAWDVYRNHRIGFIFQSYNLIPHQTILGNVELALTIAGISKEERIRRAKEAIDRVGLKGQYNKKPNQLSGGQCQRVAIARALVNEPEILLADEPTGALDTTTSVQIMDLIKEIANDKLVIMVTHNPELAEKYSTRIIRLLDGKVLSDSNPYTEEDEIKECAESKKVSSEREKAKMSFFTAFKLSFKNLMSKAKRTVLTVIAGSIGIVGVASVLSVSQGVKDYIDSMQDDMLSGNPITIEREGFDYSSLMSGLDFNTKLDALEKGDWVNVESIVEGLIRNQDVLMSIMYNNTFTKDYVDYVKSMPKEYYSSISLNYDLSISDMIYTDFKYSNSSQTKYDRTMSVSAITANYQGIIENLDDYAKYSEIITSLVSSFNQGVADNDYILTQYDILDGTLPQNANDIVIVLSSDETINDLLLAQLGYYTQEEFMNIVWRGLESDLYNPALDKNKFTYEEMLGKEFTWYPNDTIYEKSDSITSPFTYNYYVDDDFTGGVKLNVCGIVKPKDDVNYGCLTSGFIYTEKLAQMIIDSNINSQIVKYINNSSTSSIPSGVIGDVKMGVYYTLPFLLTTSDTPVEKTIDVFLGQGNAMSSIMGITNSTIANLKYITTQSVGGDRLPSSISIYPTNFDEKDKVTSYLDMWNTDTEVTFNTYDDHYENVTGEKTLGYGEEFGRVDIKYMDTVGLIISMINMMINLVTVALVSFSGLALVVSAVMIGIITYVSVVERTKEIGVIRSLGGRKKDVSNLFNAETVMIGLSSGVFGIIVTAIISTILNLLTKGAIGANIANLTLNIAITMIVISVLLTVVSGFIPAKSAAKRDPVEALRSE